MTQITILGGAGAMALATIHDLLETAGDIKLILADYNERAAKMRVETLRDHRLTACICDGRDPQSLRAACKGSDVIINCINAGNLVACQQAALDVGADYLDLGSWPEETEAQLALGPKFQAIEHIAILGAGSAPGISNMMAAAAVAHLDTVDSVHIKLAKVYLSETPSPLNPPYALRTILEELTSPPLVLEGGRLVRVPPQSGQETLTCPDPLGSVEIMHVIHPEPFTFARSFAHKGLKDASFKICLPRELLGRLRFLLSLGLGQDRTIDINGASVNLRALLLSLARDFSSEILDPGHPPQDFGYTLVVVQGTRSGRATESRAELLGRAHQRWGLSGGTVRTGVPASIIAQMILRREIGPLGCFPPEQCVPPRLFFTYLAQRGMEVHLTYREAAFDRE